MTIQVILCIAQNNLSSMSDFDRITLSPVIVGNSKIPSYAQTYAEDKLKSIVAQYGLASNAGESRFIITMNLVEITKNYSPTQPAMLAITLSPTIYIGDAETGTLFSSISLPPIKGAGTNENKAYIQALRGINIQNPGVVNCIEDGKAKIIEFYNSQIDIVLNQASSLVGQGYYEDALALLASVPSVCKEAFLKAQNQSITIYQQMIDANGLFFLNKAIQAWNSNQSYSGAEESAKYLMQIDPLSSSAKEAMELSRKIGQRISEIDRREWDFKMQQYEDQYNLAVQKQADDYTLSSQLISAARDIGIAKAKQKIIYNSYNNYNTSYSVSYRYTKVNWW